MKYYIALKERDILSFMITWVKLEAIILSEINHTEKEKYCMASLTCEHFFLSQTHRNSVEWWLSGTELWGK